MLSIEGRNIKISQGDTFNIIFQVYGYEFKNTDIVVFTVKKGEYTNEPLIQKTYENIQDNRINVVVSADEMDDLETGDYVYDLVCKSDDVILTLNYPSKLKIVGVVHDDM